MRNQNQIWTSTIVLQQHQVRASKQIPASEKFDRKKNKESIETIQQRK